MANFRKSASFSGLTTSTVTVTTTGNYSIQGTLTLPSSDGSALTGPGGGAGTGTGAGPRIPSQVVTTIKQNLTTLFTTVAGSKGFCLVSVPLTAGDVISFVTTSSLSQDQQPNAVRLTIAISEGPL